MSSSQVVDWVGNGKIYTDLLPNPYPYPAQANPLAQVLIAGQDAGNQDITNLNQLEVTNIVQQAAIGGHLSVGGPGGDLRIEGATDKGSLLVGDGTSTKELVVGTNGLVLTTNSAAPYGVEWGVGGGGGGVASVSAGSNIAVTGTATNPIVAVASPLNATLNLGTQNTTGTTGALTYDDAVSNNKGVLGAISLILSDSTFATGDQTQTYKTGYSAIGSTDTTTLSKTGLSKTLGATDLTISNSVAAQNIALNTTSGIITTNCAIKPTAIRDSASSNGTSGQVLTAGTGGQLLWGANGVSSITAGTNISVTGTASVPVVNLQNPLTATLNLGTQNLTGSTSNITLSSGTNQANMNGNLGFTSSVQATPTTKANLFNTSISIETSTNKVAINPTSIIKSVGATAFTIGSTTAPLSLLGSGAGADSIQIQQLGLVGTALTTSLSNVKYYPDTYINNNNSNSVSVPLPQVDYQRLTLNNLGLTNTNNWTDYGNNVYSGYSAFTIDGAGNYWYAEQGSGNIQVIDSGFNLVATLQLTNSGGPGTINCFYNQGGFMWIGGLFTSVQDANGVNATPQFNITRINGSYLCDPISDGSSIYGSFPGTEVYCITDVNGEIVFGGNFSNFSNGSTCNYIAKISSPYTASGSQFFNEFANGVNGRVYAIHHEGFLNYTFVGGDFTSVDVSVSPLGYQYCAYYDNGFPIWGSVASNQFNNGVKVIKSTPYSQLFVAGNFTQIAGTGQDYNTYIDPTNPGNWSDTTLTMTSPVDYKQAYYSGEIGVYNISQGAFFKSSAYQAWTSLGTPGGSGTLTGVNYSGSWKVIYDSYGYVRSHSVLPHSCVFTGSFVYDGTSYANYTITTRNVSQQFIGDDNNSFWSIIGQGVGAFS